MALRLQVRELKLLLSVHMPNLVNPYRYTITPQGIPDLLLWLDADDTSTLTLVSGDVSQWRDKSGNGYHFSQTTPARRPRHGDLTINNKPTVSFTGANNEYLTRSGALGLTGNPALTFIYVSYIVSFNITIDTVLYLGDNSANSMGKNIYYSTGTQGLAIRYNNGNEIYGVEPTTTRHIIVHRRAAGATYNGNRCWVNGVETSPVSSANPTFTPAVENDHAIIGTGWNTNTASYSGQWYNNRIGEMVLVEREMPFDEINALCGGYFASKWLFTENWTNIT